MLEKYTFYGDGQPKGFVIHRIPYMFNVRIVAWYDNKGSPIEAQYVRYLPGNDYRAISAVQKRHRHVWEYIQRWGQHMKNAESLN